MIKDYESHFLSVKGYFIENEYDRRLKKNA
jgi:hypothetical protein